MWCTNKHLPSSSCSLLYLFKTSVLACSRLSLSTSCSSRKCFFSSLELSLPKSSLWMSWSCSYSSTLSPSINNVVDQSVSGWTLWVFSSPSKTSKGLMCSLLLWCRSTEPDSLTFVLSSSSLLCYKIKCMKGKIYWQNLLLVQKKLMKSFIPTTFLFIWSGFWIQTKCNFMASTCRLREVNFYQKVSKVLQHIQCVYLSVCTFSLKG